jgi:hypothetical protein
MDMAINSAVLRSYAVLAATREVVNFPLLVLVGG